MEIYQKAVLCRADRLQEREPQDPVPEQRPKQEALADHRGKIPGMNPFNRIKGFKQLIVCQSGDASFTYGCLEPTMLTQMAKFLDTVYVSGWQCSSTASSSDEPGPDLADYPMVG